MDDFELEDIYCLDHVIGRGGYGTVYAGHDKNNKRAVAVKIEMISDCEPEDSFLGIEYDIYSKLSGKDSIGIPDVKLFGYDEVYEGPRSYLVMGLLGPDLEELLHQCLGKFSLKTVLLLANQMIGIIQYVHSKGFIHGDVKPGNFLLGRKKHDKMLYMVDFGLAKLYRDAKTQEHIPYSDTASYQGTTRFASLNCHHGIQQSRRDDLESMGYVLLYLLRGNLPWQGLEVSNTSDKKKKRKLVCEKKLSTSLDQLCSGYPCEFVTFMKYCRSLKFDEEPDYDNLQRLFKDLFDRSGYSVQSEFDWIENLKKEQFLRESSINSSYVKPWEVVNFLHGNYSALSAKKSMENTCIEELVIEAFNFAFPLGVPEIDPEFTQCKSGESWESAVPKFCDSFFSIETNKWFKDVFYLDYSTADQNQHLAQQTELENRMAKAAHDPFQNALILACRMDKVFQYIGSSEKLTETPSGRNVEDKLRGMIYDIISYLGIPQWYSGEGRVDFLHPLIPERKKNPLVIKVKPDSTLCVEGGFGFLDPEPFGVIKVYSPSDPSVLNRVQVASSGKFSHRTRKEELEEKTVLENLSSLSLNDEDDTHDNDLESHNSVYCNNAFHLKVNKELKRFGPLNCSQDKAFQKLFSQLPLEMYGVLAKREEYATGNLRSNEKAHTVTAWINQRTKVECIGLFVMNERVYLAKASHLLYYLFNVRNCIPNREIHGPNFVFAKNWHFNLKRSTDRLAFMIFLQYYHRILKCEKVSEIETLKHI